MTALRPFEDDIAPTKIGQGILDVLDHEHVSPSQWSDKAGWKVAPANVRQKNAGLNDLSPLTGTLASQLVGDELQRVIDKHGNQAIYAGSYGWASAGRFHHAQSQIHRFLNVIGGYTKSVNTYSFAAAEVMMPHVIGDFRLHLQPDKLGLGHWQYRVICGLWWGAAEKRTDWSRWCWTPHSARVNFGRA